MPITDFVRLKSYKMYMFIIEEVTNNECKKAKNINKNVVIGELKYDDYQMVCSICHLRGMK